MSGERHCGGGDHRASGGGRNGVLGQVSASDRAGRADPYVNPSWPNSMRPPPTELPTVERDGRETSWYEDPERDRLGDGE